MSIPFPHDRLFRAIFRKPRHAAELFRAVLPSDLVPHLDFDKLEERQSGGVDHALEERRADLVFELSCIGSTIPVFIACEAQSAPHPRMSYRMLRYIIDIWERETTERDGVRSFPVVIPLVVHHGPGGWGGAPRHLHELHDVPAEIEAAVQKWLPRADFVLVDLADLSDEVLLEKLELSAVPRLVLYCLKHGRQAGDPAEMLHTVADLMSQVPETPCNRDSLVAVWLYIVEVVDMPPERIQRTLADKLVPQAAEALSTAAEQLRNEGVIKMLAKQLRHRFGELSMDAEQRILSADSEQLDRWSMRVLDASTLGDVFADDDPSTANGG